MQSEIRIILSGLWLGAQLLAGYAALGFVQPAKAAAPASVSGEANYLTQNTAVMNLMMANMTIRPSGDADIDFVSMMVPHHQGAIDMAQAELVYGHNEQLARIAQGIIVEQLQEIAAMRLAVGEPASPTWATDAAIQDRGRSIKFSGSLQAEAPFLAQMAVAMTTMMNNMSVAPRGDVDHDFVAMMVPHHQGAIDMAQAELRYGQNAELKLIAQEIIVDQLDEITLMRIATGEPLPRPAAAPTQSASMKIAPQPSAAATTMGMTMRASPINNPN